MLYFIASEDFFVYIQNPSEHSFMIIFIISIALFLIYDIVFMKENFCTYVCPYSRIQSVLYDDDTKQVSYDYTRGGKIYENNVKSIFKLKDLSSNDECTTCEACVKICPTHIDIRKGLQVECINCLECSDACSTVMKNFDKPSLINWGSTNKVINKKNISVFTKRNITYFASLFLCIFLAFYFSLEKEDFLVNVNKTTQLFKTKENGVIANNYVLTFHNTQDKTLIFHIKLEDEKNYKIKRFESFTLEAGKKIKKVLIIETTKDYIKPKNNENITIEIKTLNENLKVIKNISFVHP
jgi:cytochrome c oxidase accessory protein FixG